ncbi:MAG TPA: NAD(P)H-hydrate dehydratase [Tepidisphaeraceae bacterium]|jgi:NAD(P)H-hydrate epimerase
MTERIVSLPPLPARPKTGHKGTFGRVLVVGGSATMIGAPAFAAAAAYRSGAGYVQIATAEAVLLSVLGHAPEAVGLALPAGDDEWNDAIDKASAVAVGPGLGQLTSGNAVVDKVLAADKPSVLDADALNLLSARDRWPAGVRARCVLTPHPGEMKRLGKLFGKTEQSPATDDRIDTAVRAAAAFGAVVALKGEDTVVTDGRRVYVNRTGDSTLSKAGTGDVLSGITAALLGQAVEPFAAACVAVWVHGKAGELAGAALGPRSATARDVIAHIGPAFEAYAAFYGQAPSSSSSGEG